MQSVPRASLTVARGAENAYGGCKGVYQIPSGAPVPNRGPETVAGIWTLLALATLFLGARLVIKHQRSRKLWWDDWILLMSWLCFIVDAIMSQLVVNLGLGKYPCDIDPRHFAQIGLLGNVGTSIGIAAILWSKTSFALTLLRLTTGPGARAVIWGLIASMNIIGGLLALFTWVQCTPITKSWDQTTPGTCWKSSVSNGYGVFSGVYTGFVDITLVGLAWRVIWSLQMKMAEKVGVAVGMSMGLFAAATAFLKASQIPTLGSDNFTCKCPDNRLLLWAAADMGTTIMAACIPVLRALIREVHTNSTSRARHDKVRGSGSNRSMGSDSRDMLDYKAPYWSMDDNKGSRVSGGQAGQPEEVLMARVHHRDLDEETAWNSLQRPHYAA